MGGGEADAENAKAALRSVVASPAVAATPRHMRLAQIDAVRLDDWTADHVLD